MLVFALVGCIENTFVPLTPPPRDLGQPLEIGPGDRTDRFLQVVEQQVDVLWVVDDSPSMEEDRRLLAQAFPEFIQWFEAVESDWHVGVITTDMETPEASGALQERGGYRFIDRDTVNPVGVFTEMVTAGSGGALREKGRDAAWTATEPLKDTVNEGFLHDSELAYLHFTVVTDEDDASDRIAVDQFVDYVNFIRPIADRTTWNSVVATQNTGTEDLGEDYLALTAALEGAIADVNDPLWPDRIRELGGTQAPEPIIEFFLSARPVDGTVDVKVTEPSGIVITFVPLVDWTWSEPRNSVTFVDYVPPLGAAVEVHYQLAAG